MAAWVIICGVTSAERIEIGQGDLVYMNETIDLSLAVSWPDYTLAWCSNENYECDPPDQVIAITGNMHQYWIDPLKFKYGTYYRWDGEWHRGENAVAFTIVKGTRGDTQEGSAADSLVAPSHIKRPEGPHTWLVARGDDPVAYTSMNRTDDCYLWIFSNNNNILGKRMGASNTSNGLVTYSYHFSEEETMNMSVGTYTAYIQCVGRNGIPDIFIDGSVMDTLYDDAIIPDVTVGVWGDDNVQGQFDTLAKSLIRFAFDDTVVPITIRVEDPIVTVRSVERNDDDTKLYIYGVTAWQNQTRIIFRLDPDNYKLQQDIRLHTWTTNVTGTINTPRTFATAISLQKDELYVGMHEIVSNVEKKHDTGVTAYSFRITDIKVMPTPTPKTVRMIYGSDWKEIPVYSENKTEYTEAVVGDPLLTSVTPIPTKRTGYGVVITSSLTITPTPDTTTIVTTPPTTEPTSRPTTTPTVVVPLPIWVCVAGIVIAGVIRK